MDDIPEALRDSKPPKQQPRKLVSKPQKQSNIAVKIGFALGALSLLSIIAGAVLNRPQAQSEVVSSSQSSSEASSSAIPSDALLGHFSYEQAPLSQLKAITPDGRLRLRSAAADKFLAMEAAARRDGIDLVPISAFRTIEEQQYLFFKVKEQRGQNTAKRAEVSAPPGYSEHHTGYAFDVGDGRNPETNLSPSFENTAAFRWLQKNAAYYSFELSFPRDNPQGVSYEPWHWRFVGDRASLETFYRSHSLKSNTKPEQINNN